MNKFLKIACCAVLPTLWAAGCNDFLTGGELDHSPNSQTSATPDVLFEGIQANMWQYQTGDLARLTSMWMQSMAGVQRQFLSYENYVLSESDYDNEWVRPYRGGGLLDIRKVESQVKEVNDLTYLGIVQVYEAWFMGTTADVWGDIPYTQAADSTIDAPALDAQQEVYAHVQAVLDSAIANLSAGQGPGPGGADLVYDGDPEKWVALAHTLKARFYLHTAEQDPSAYALALSEAQQGIQTDSTNSGDYKPVFSGNDGEKNPWHQFMVDERSGYLQAGENMVSLLKDRQASEGDPRLELYFTKISEKDTTEINGTPAGTDDGNATLSDERLDATFPQPVVTAKENLLIEAEAQFQTGDEPGALASLNAERALWGLDPLTGLSGPALLNEIMTEKYIALFQNIETWNDYKRTCVPAITPVGGKQEVPARLLYGTSSRQTNPENFPEPSAQPRHNWNDLHGCNGGW